MMINVSMNGQERRFYGFFRNYGNETIDSYIKKQKENCKANKEMLSFKKILNSSRENIWSDGIHVIRTAYDDSDNTLEIYTVEQGRELIKNFKGLGPLKIKGKYAVNKERPRNKITMELLGGEVMLIERDVAGNVVGAYYRVEEDDYYHDYWTLPVVEMLMGSYETPDGEVAVFGPRYPHYSGRRYDTDPGMFCYYINPDFGSIDIEYAHERISRGDPSSPKYDKMPGGGGAGALMPPMVWNLKICKDGLIAKVLRDEPFVDHSPGISTEGEVLLKKLESPYEGINGKWAFASMMPLTPELLKLFPRDVLTLMAGEIYARYGDSFKNAKTQAYFNAQPWYKRKAGPFALTDLERYNYKLIQQAIKNK